MKYWPVGVLLALQWVNTALSEQSSTDYEVALGSAKAFEQVLTKQNNRAKGWSVPLFRVFDDKGQLRYEHGGKVKAPVTFSGPVLLARNLSKEFALLGQPQPPLNEHTVVVYELENKLCPPCEKIIGESLPELSSAYGHPLNVVRVRLVEKKIKIMRRDA